MANTIFTQTSPGVNGTNGICSPMRAPTHARVWAQVGWWLARRRRGGGPPGLPPPMPTPSPLVVQHTTKTGTGIVPIYTPINFQGDSFVNAPNATISIINNSGQNVKVQVIGEQVCSQNYLHNYLIDIPSGLGQPVEMGPFDFHYNDSSGSVHINYAFNSGLVAGVTIAVTAP